MLAPLGKPHPQELQDRGYRMVELLQGLTVTQQPDLACRTLLAVLIALCPEMPTTNEEREAFKTLCPEVQVWLKDEIKELRHPHEYTRKLPENGTPPRRVGHA